MLVAHAIDWYDSYRIASHAVWVLRPCLWGRLHSRFSEMLWLSLLLSTSVYMSE